MASVIFYRYIPVPRGRECCCYRFGAAQANPRSMLSRKFDRDRSTVAPEAEAVRYLRLIGIL